MSITVCNLSYHYPNGDFLFEHLNFSVAKQEKVALVGSNGTGKSTLLRLIAGELQPAAGSVMSASPPYYVPQHTGALHRSVAEALHVGDKLAALNAILRGSVAQADYDALADDWAIEARCREAFAFWQMSHIPLYAQMDDLSGGEKTKVYLAGLLIHKPDILLLDEPTNHLDETARQLLYRYIRQSAATIVAVSHDVALLNQLPVTCELSARGIHVYGGNYSFYREQKDMEEKALQDDIHAEEKALRLARAKAQEVRERQEKRLSKGAKKKTEVPRIFRKTLANSSENTAAGLKEKHEEMLVGHQVRLSGLMQQRGRMEDLKVDFDHASIHPGKLLVEARQINFAYRPSCLLWKNPLDFKLYSHDRIHLSGDNGTGKTTLARLLTGALTPSCGTVVRRAPFRRVYLDQDYASADADCSIEALAAAHKPADMEMHEVKLRLNRFLFPSDTWRKSCRTLSGGEKMRLCLCCLMIGNQTPDLIILDEPTNNLDLPSLQVLIRTIKGYRGSLLVISHDRYFTDEIGINRKLTLE